VLKLKLKSTARSLLGGLFSPLGKLYTENKLTIFCYHDVSNNPSEFSKKHDLNVYPKVFDYQINFIDNNFNVISPDDLLNEKIPENAALITFDDGFKSYFNTAITILEKYNIPSIILLNMGPIKGEIFWAGLITYLSENSSDFYNYITTYTKCNLKEKPLFLYCSKELVNSFLATKNKTYRDEVNGYVGNFATENDLQSVSTNNLVYFGNHLYNHDVPLLMSDKELLKSYFKNDEELKKYPNSRNMFAFPFGQPDSCFSNRQIELIIENGARKIFSTYPIVNSDTSAPYMHRIPLNSFNNTKARIWFNILRRSFKI
jgi:hypothetical protein